MTGPVVTSVIEVRDDRTGGELKVSFCKSSFFIVYRNFLCQWFIIIIAYIDT